MKEILAVLFIPIIAIIGYLLWLVRSPESRPEYYEQSKCEKIKEVVDKYDPK